MQVQATNANPEAVPNGPLDVWLLFDDAEDESPSHEANTYLDGDGCRVEYYHVDVGVVTRQWFTTYADAVAWYERCGYQDFTVEA